MKINFNSYLKDFRDPEKETDIHLGENLALMLANSNKGDAVKFMSWAHKLMSKQELDLDTSDQKTLKDFIEKHEGVSNLIKAALLEVIIDTELEVKARDKKEKR